MCGAGKGVWCRGGCVSAGEGVCKCGEVSV